MGEQKQIAVTFRELAAALVKEQNLHEGIWGVYIEFGIAAANIGPTADDIRPAALVPILKIGIQTYDEPSNLTVDAAQINPEK